MWREERKRIFFWPEIKVTVPSTQPTRGVTSYPTPKPCTRGRQVEPFDFFSRLPDTSTSISTGKGAILLSTCHPLCSILATLITNIFLFIQTTTDMVDLRKTASKMAMFFLFKWLLSVLSCIVCAGFTVLYALWRTVLFALVALHSMCFVALDCMRLVALVCMCWSHLVLPFLFNQCMGAILMSTCRHFFPCLQPLILIYFYFHPDNDGSSFIFHGCR